MTEDELLDWALELDQEERSYLLRVASSEHETTVQLTSAQDSKIIAVFGWSVLGIGTLALSDALTFAASLQGIGSILAIASTVLVLLAGTFALWPRSLSLGVRSSWFSEWTNPKAEDMQAYALVALLQANEINDRLLECRAAAQKVMGIGLALEVLLIVLVLITKATGD